MKQEELIENIDMRRESLLARLTQLEKLRWFVENRSSVFENLPDCSIFNEQLDFDSLNREELLLVLKAFPGKWRKTPNGDKVDYAITMEEVDIRCYQADAPPSCKLVKKYRTVPAVEEHTEEYYELQCKEEPQ